MADRNQPAEPFPSQAEVSTTPTRAKPVWLPALLEPVWPGASLQRLAEFLAWLSELGTQGYPPDVRRRLKILNLIAYLIATTTAVYAAQHIFLDYDRFAPLIWVNLALVTLGPIVPWSHRFGPTAGGIIVVAAEWVALTVISKLIGADSGVHLQFFVACAAPFVVFGLERMRLVLATVVSGIVLHVVCQFAFEHDAVLDADPEMINAIYIQAAVTTGGLIAASVWYAFRLAEDAKAQTDRLLRNILPVSIVERLEVKPGAVIADSYDHVAVLFADISGFVPLARELGPERVVGLLNELVGRFDTLAERHGIEKIKTIGDAYMAAAGAPMPVPDPETRMTRFALAMLEEVALVRARHHIDLQMRVGIAAGPVMAGIIGRQKFSYDIWGDTVNLAARLENRSERGRILVCPTCRIALQHEFQLEDRGEIELKGLGAMPVWHVVGPLTV